MSESEPGNIYELVHAEPLLIVISGPSGVGKDTVIQRMKDRHLPFSFVVTTTTRQPRQDEVDGMDYNFVSHDQFAELIENGELLEYAIVYNDYKGIPKSQVRQAINSGLDVIMRIDVQGAATIRAICPEALLIFLTVENESNLIDRLQIRKSETPEGLKLRIATARRELTRSKDFDYVVVNRDDKVDETVDIIQAIITAEHHRTSHRKVTL